MMSPVTSRDWIEDFEHENGQYQNRCFECKELFIGHKRRLDCKRCVMVSLNTKVKLYRATLKQIANRHPDELAQAKTLHYDMCGWAKAVLEENND